MKAPPPCRRLAAALSMKRVRRHKAHGDQNGTGKCELQALDTKLSSLQSKIPAGAGHAPRLDAGQMLKNSMERNINVIRNIVSLIPSSSKGAVVSTTPVTREWENTFLREPYGIERPCLAMGSNAGCWASRLQGNARVVRPGLPNPEPLVLREFYTPAEYAAIEANAWKWPETRSLCVMCTRAATHAMFVQIRASNRRVPKDVGFSRVSNLVDIPGEYHSADCFISAPDRFEGVIDPVVIPRLVDYDVSTLNGVRHVTQKLGVPGPVVASFVWPKPLDFRH